MVGEDSENEFGKNESYGDILQRFGESIMDVRDTIATWLSVDVNAF